MLNPHLTYQLISADNGADYNIEDVEEDFPGDEEHMIFGIELKMPFHQCSSDYCHDLDKPSITENEDGKLHCCCPKNYMHNLDEYWGYGQYCTPPRNDYTLAHYGTADVSTFDKEPADSDNSRPCISC